LSIASNVSTPEMDTIFSPANEVQRWLDFESALARVEAAHGLVPAAAADEITAKAKVDLLDLEQLATDIGQAVHPVMPFVRAFAAICEGGHGEYVHWGATTQDVLDTGLTLRLAEADDLIRRDLDALIDALRDRAVEHRDTPMAGRTHAQHAVPITFGYKLAVWVDELQRHRATLERIGPEVLVGQFGGATGTLASLGLPGLDIRRDLMAELGLGEPAISWHVARDRVAHYTFILTLVASAIERLGLEIVTLQRDEIGELFEPFHTGKVGSSTMPHKRNPAMSESLVTLGELVKHDVGTALAGLNNLHERDKAIFAVESDYVPRVCRHTHRMLRLATTIVTGMTVDADRMRHNLEASNGQLFSERVMMTLAATLGRQTAHDVVYDASMAAFEDGEHLRDALARDERITDVLTEADIDALFDLGEINAAAGVFVDRVCGP
jgi:3-carboxy-cis,cis-muconate cycloisomerase